MKRILLILTIVSAFTHSAIAQIKKDIKRDSLLNEVLQEYRRMESAYLCNVSSNTNKETKRNESDPLAARVVNHHAFDSLFRPIISKVVVNNEELVKNGSAASLSFSEVTKKLSINHSWKKSNELFWNLGFNAESASDNLFEIYNKDGWNQGLGISGGITSPFGLKTLIFLPSDCEDLKSKRQGYFPSLIGQYDTLLASKDIINSKLQIYRSINYAIHDLDSIKILLNRSFSTESDFKKALADSTMIARLERSPNEVLRDAITTFEQSNFTNFGYKIKWVNFGGGIDYKTFNIYDTAVKRIAEVDKEDTWRAKLYVNLNWMRKGAKKYLVYASGGVTVGNTNYIEELLPDEISKLKEADATNSISISETNKAFVVNDYRKFKKNYAYINPSIGGNLFFGRNRSIGLELRADTKFKVFVPEEIDAHNTFTFKSGLLFSFDGKDQLSKTTFGLIASFNEIPFDDWTSKDRFVLGIRIGIPFEVK